jgi:pentose-5-phosphate-3-epimerase
MREPVIVASVLGADYARLGQEVAELEAAGVDRVQWDVMDSRADLLVAGSAILTHPEGRATAVAQLRRAFTTTRTTDIHSNRDGAG